MTPNDNQPVKQSPELSECSPLVTPKTFRNNNNYNSVSSPTTQQPVNIRNIDAAEGQYLHDETSCKCRSGLFSIGAIGLIFLGGMTVGCYLLNQFDHEWVTNMPFELVDRRNWQPLDSLPRVRNSRSETRTKTDKESSNLGRESLSASRDSDRSTSNTKESSLPLVQEDVLEIFAEQQNSSSESDLDTKTSEKPEIRNPKKQKATYLVIAHTEGPECNKKEHCLQILRQLHAKSVTEMGLLDVPYNFLIGGDGQTYEGRGWYGRDALRHSLKNETVLSVAFIGDFTHDLPPRKQLEEAKAFIIESIRRRKLSPHYHLVGHRQINENTKSPGDALMREIAGWRHWRPCSKTYC